MINAEVRKQLNEDLTDPVRLIIFSHLSDIQASSNQENRNKANFVKYLVSKYLTNNVLINADAEYEEYLQKYGK